MAGILFLLIDSHAWPQSQQATPGIWQRNSLTGDWGGLRSEWADRGIHVEGSYIGDVFANLDGGLDEDTAYLDALDLKLLLDMAELADWSGGNVLIRGLYNNGGSVSAHVGDIQGVNNIEAPRGFKLYEAWVQQNLLSNRLTVLAGLYDINSEFDVIQSAGLFINSSHGIGAEFAASGLAGPSIYPFTALSVRLKTLLTPSLYFQAVVSDGVPGDPDDRNDNALIIRDEEGAFLAAEIGWYLLEGNGDSVGAKGFSTPARRQYIGREVPASYKTKLALGVWGYTSDFEKLRRANGQPPATSARDNGIYGLLDWNAYQEPHDEAQGLAAFLRLGYANNDASRFSFYGGAGLIYTGLVAGRDKDEIGLALAVARNSDYTKSVSTQALDDTETTIELTYRARLAPWLVFQPDVQYVINPGAVPTLQNALVIGVRLEINL